MRKLPDHRRAVLSALFEHVIAPLVVECSGVDESVEQLKRSLTLWCTNRGLTHAVTAQVLGKSERWVRNYLLGLGQLQKAKRYSGYQLWTRVLQWCLDLGRPATAQELYETLRRRTGHQATLPDLVKTLDGLVALGHLTRDDGGSPSGGSVPTYSASARTVLHTEPTVGHSSKELAAILGARLSGLGAVLSDYARGDTGAVVGAFDGRVNAQVWQRTVQEIRDFATAKFQQAVSESADLPELQEVTTYALFVMGTPKGDDDDG